MKHKKWHQYLPSEDLHLCEENLELFFRTMFERQEIWHKRSLLGKSQPWTNDEILRDFKFTNVYRELDRNSQWQIENVIKKNYGSKKELLWQLVVFRFFNSPGFFDFVRELSENSNMGFKGHFPNYDSFKPELVHDLMKRYRESGHNRNPFTTAYLTNSMVCPGKTRDWCYAFKVIPALHEMIPSLLKTLALAKRPEDIISKLEELPSVSHFMSHELYQDLTYVPIYSSERFMRFGQNDFTNVGPGAKVGIRLIFPNLSTNEERIEAIYNLRDLSREMLAEHGKFKYLGYDKDKGEYFVDKKGELTLHQIEMWLCEFQKYFKMQVGEGKQRSKFVPR